MESYRPVRWSEASLAEIIAKHGGPESLNLAGDDLSGLDLAYFDLRGAVFSRWYDEKTPPLVANLSGAQLLGADLRGAQMQMAQLAGAVLMDAKLQRASLFRADLTGANLRHTNMRRTVLKEAILTGVDLGEARLDGADLTRSKAEGPRMSAEGAFFTEARLGGVCWANCWLEKAHLEKALLVNSHLSGAMMAEAAMTGACLEGADLEGASLQQADLRGADLTRASLRGADLRKSDLRETDLCALRPGGLDSVRLAGAVLGQTKLRRQQLGNRIAEEQERKNADAWRAYSALRANFQSIGDLEAAAWAYTRERRMEMLSSSNVLKRVLDGAQWVVCDFGESPWRVLLTIIAVYLLFALLYMCPGVLNWVVETPCGLVRVPVSDPGAALLFSLGAMTTLEAHWLEPAAPWVGAVMGIEALLGIGLTGLLGFVLGNRIRRS